MYKKKRYLKKYHLEQFHSKPSNYKMSMLLHKKYDPHITVFYEKSRRKRMTELPT